MTVKELIDDLSRFPDSSRVIFSPKDMCGGGWPEWSEAWVSAEMGYIEEVDDERPTGRVIVSLAGEIE